MTTRQIIETIEFEEGCPVCGLGNFPNMPGELCDECQITEAKGQDNDTHSH